MGRMGTPRDNFRVIAGRYRLEARLGWGGMGVVWRATDLLLWRGVAVKELSLDETLPEGEVRRRRDRVLREARAVSRLRHPHIIVVHDVVEDGELPYLIMELIEGGSLADRIAAHGPVGASEAARIGIALLGALRAAHAAGVQHRDIKPSNVLIADDGRVVLADFGVAQVAGATTSTEPDSFVGSPEYTAPERMSGAAAGPESDLWSVGVLLCAVLGGGTSPFRRDSLGGVLRAVVSDEIRPPARAAPLLPVVRGLLERDPRRRLDAAGAERMLRGFLEAGSAAVGAHSMSVGSASYAPAWWDVPWSSAREPATPPWYAHRSLLVAVLLVATLVVAGVSAAALLFHGCGGVPGP